MNVYNFELYLLKIFSLTYKEEILHFHKNPKEVFAHIDEYFIENQNYTTSSHHELFKLIFKDKTLYKYPSGKDFIQVEMDRNYLDWIQSPDNPYSTIIGLHAYPNEENIYVLYHVVKEDGYAIILKLYFDRNFEFDTRNYFKTIYYVIFKNN